MQPLCGNNECNFLFVSITHDFAFKKSAFNIVALCFFCKYHRHTHLFGANRCKRNAGRFDSHNRRQSVYVKMSNEFIRQLAQKSSVNAVVQKSVNLYNIAGKNLSLARNALLQKFHAERPPCFQVVRSKSADFSKKACKSKPFWACSRSAPHFPNKYLNFTINPQVSQGKTSVILYTIAGIHQRFKSPPAADRGGSVSCFFYMSATALSIFI